MCFIDYIENVRFIKRFMRILRTQILDFFSWKSYKVIESIYGN